VTPRTVASAVLAAALAVTTLTTLTTLAACGSASTPAGSPGGGASVAATTVTEPWVVVPPTPDTTAAFGTLHNTSAAEVRLVGVDTDVAAMVQVHETVTEGNVAHMQEVAGGLAIPAGGTVQLKPGGYHVMLMQLTRPVAEGDSVDLTFRFSDGSAVTVTAPVRARAGMATSSGSANSMG
jgi:copper(I)-binding protein